MIDLHTHTDESDGTLSPRALVEEAARIGVQALAITDHDTFAGYEKAFDEAAKAQVELICGVELSTKHKGRSVHLLAYFFEQQPTEKFRGWVKSLEASRNQRNNVLVKQLQDQGIQITLEEVSLGAQRIIARPHFAAFMLKRGYVSSMQKAFDEYLGECGTCYVSRQEPEFEEAAAEILASRGLAVLPHPGRFTRDAKILERELIRMREFGLRGIEVYHSDHSAADFECYSTLASKLGLAVTGGSDFHGCVKPNVLLGTGIRGNVNIPRSILNELRRFVGA
jgi:predicted metal-dependent phosphoesterase TrpH